MWVLNARPPHKALGLVQAAPLDVLARLPSRRSLLKTEHATAELRVPCCRQGSEVSVLNSMNINHLSEPINQRGTGGGGGRSPQAARPAAVTDNSPPGRRAHPDVCGQERSPR